DVRVEALDRLHQADVAFLDQVAQWQPVTAVATGDVDDEAQVRQDQLLRGLQVVVVAQAAGEALFVFDGQHRDLVHAADIRLQRTKRARSRQGQDGQVFGDK